MKKILFITGVIISLLNVNIYPAEYTLYGEVYNYDGTSGTAGTPNSFALLNAYREGIPGQIGHQNNGENPSYLHKIYAADGSNPAYFFTEIGSSDWALTPPVAGQVVISVVETGEPENGWTGDSYVACTITVITPADIINSQTNMPPVNLELIPAPSIINEGIDYITVGWTGLQNDLIVGYTLYRSDDGGINYNPITVTGQDKGGQILYIDNDPGLGGGITYYYKIAVNFVWGGGGGAPEYYETYIKSKASSGAQIHPATPTPTYTPTQTETETSTPTYTYTMTDTYTATATETATETNTLTFTETETNTLTATYTVTHTYTATPSFTYTPTFTETKTPVPSATDTPVLMSQTLISNIEKQKVIIMNNPIKGNKIKIGLYCEEAGIAEIYMYNAKAELVRKIVSSVSSGVNILEDEIKNKSSGIYVLRISVNNKDLPLRKIAVIM